jgi:hypothetical protein
LAAVVFLVRPPALTDGYTTFAYQVKNASVEDDRGLLGFAVHRVIVMPTRLLMIDWSWLGYIGIVSLLVVLLWYRLRFSWLLLLGFGVLSGFGIHEILATVEWYIPTAWSVLAICAYPVVLYCVQPLCRPRDFTSLQWAVVLVLIVAALRWATPLGVIILAIVYVWATYICGDQSNF